MDGRKLLRQLYAHMEWADASVWSEALKVDRASDDQRLRDKLHHLHETQQAYVSMWTGQPSRSAEDGDSLAAIYAQAQAFYPAAGRFLAATDEQALASRCRAPSPNACSSTSGLHEARSHSGTPRFRSCRIRHTTAGRS